jgi:Cytochrome P460
MNTKPITLIVVAAAILGAFASRAHQAPATTNSPSYTADGQLRFPANYRQWVYVTTGFDMSYNPAQSTDHHMFDNVFVNPEAYAAFLNSGTWPDKTMLFIEVRGAKNKGSINQAGHFQDTDVMGLEVHVKDESRFHAQGNWAFFGFKPSAITAAAGAAPAASAQANPPGAQAPQQSASTSRMTPTSAACYSCHAQHAAVDTTFVQFYPTLLPIAQAHQTLSPNYTKESATKP